MDANLRQELTDDLRQAIRDGDKVKCLVIRSLMASIKNTEIARTTDITKAQPLDNAGISSVIAKEIRQHQESIEAFKKGNRSDLVAKEEIELAVLSQYMPKQMARDEIIAEVRKVIAEVGAQGLGDKGKVMSKLMAQLRGRADGREINAIVTEMLSP